MGKPAACLRGVLRIATIVIETIIITTVITTAPASADVSDYLGKPISSVRLTVEGRETNDQRLVPFVATMTGRPLSMMDVRESVLHLYSTGRFDDVRVSADSGETGVALHYQLMPVHPVERIVLTGSARAAGIDEGRLRSVVIDRYGASPPAGRAQDMARLIEEQLRQRGYLAARVASRVTLEHAPDRATLTFTIDAGARTHVGTVSVDSGRGVVESELLKELGLSTGVPYEPDVIAERIERYRASRRSRGYFEARVVTNVRFADDDRVANMTLEADLGPRVRVAFAGDPLPSAQREELVPIAREGSASEDVLEDASNNLQSYLRAQGYRDAVVTHTRQDSGDDLLITFTAKRGPQYRVASVDVTGNLTISLQDLLPRLRLKAGQPFASSQLEADLETILELYRRLGFSAVAIEPVVEPTSGDADDATQVFVSVRFQVREGVQTIVDSVTIAGNGSVAEQTLRNGLGLQPGRPFFLPQMAIDRDTLQLHYANRGYPGATVETNPGLNADGSRAAVVFTIREGPLIVVDHVLIAGNTRTRTETIERELQLKPGDPLGLEDVLESQRRLAALGLFRRSRITQLAHGDETTRDLLITVEESPATTVGYGGGLEAGQRIGTRQSGVASEQVEVAPRAFFEVGRRNLFGKNRSINLFTRISLRPDQTSDPATSDDSGYGFSEYRVLGTFRESRAFGTAADAFLTATVEQQRRASFNFARRALSGELARRLTQQLSVGGNYQIQRTELFDVNVSDIDDEEIQLIDRLFPQVRISSFSFSAVRDGRDDALNPAAGQYLSANVQLAARSIGSEVGFAKSYLTAQYFRRVRASQVVFAASGRVGTAAGFPRDVSRTDAAGNVIVGADGQPVVDTVKALPASERFFAGGDTTVRGFAVDQLGTPQTIDQKGFPVGGNAVVILNGELRVPVFGGFGIVGFVDTGNVFAQTSDFALSELRTAVGFGVRYRSPVGPIRIDMGFKLDRRELVPGTLERPFAVHISLGQAF